MKTKLIQEKGRVSLVVDEPGKKRGEYTVLAAMTLYEGTGCWQLTDCRLAEYRQPSPYFGGLIASDLHARFTPASPEESTFVKLLLREYTEHMDGTLSWCSFDGIVRGSPAVNGYTPPRYDDFDQAGYFSRQQGLTKLAEMRDFWDGHQGSPLHVRIPNPHKQPTESQISNLVIMKRMAGELPDVTNGNARPGFDTPAPPPMD